MHGQEHRIVLATGEAVVVRDADLSVENDCLVLETPSVVYRFPLRNVSYYVTRRRQ